MNVFFFVAENETGEPPHGYHLVRLMTFIPGEIFVNVPYTPNLLYQAGRHVASIEKALMVRYLQNVYYLGVWCEIVRNVMLISNRNEHIWKYLYNFNSD